MFCTDLRTNNHSTCIALIDWFFITEVESVYCAVHTESLLGALAKLHKALLAASGLPARLSIHVKQIGCHWMDFNEL
jgi:hypothetical protein